MDIPSFISFYTGKQLTDNHGNFLGECLSLCKRFAQEQLGIPNADAVLYAPADAAKNVYLQPTDAILEYFDLFSSDPQEGDIIVYTTGTYGDVAIYIGNGTVFGQLGYPVYAKAAPRSIGNFGGILRYKGEEYMGFNYNSIPSDDEKTKYFQQHLGRDPSAAELANKQSWGEVNGVVADELVTKVSALQDQVLNPKGFKQYNPPTPLYQPN